MKVTYRHESPGRDHQSEPENHIMNNSSGSNQIVAQQENKEEDGSPANKTEPCVPEEDLVEMRSNSENRPTLEAGLASEEDDDGKDVAEFKSTNNNHSQVETANENVFPDGSWGWMCVLGCTLVHFMLGGYTRSYGIIYIEVKRVFHASSTVGAWVGGLATAFRMAGAPIATGLSNRFTARSVVFTGGLILGCSALISATAPNAEFLFFSHSIMAGVGGAMVYAPSIVIVGQYFNKRRAIANGIGCAGSGLGAFVFPPVVERLFSTYGFSGCLIIQGGLIFHCCVSGLLYRPIEKQRRMMRLELVEERREIDSCVDDKKVSSLPKEGEVTAAAGGQETESLTENAKSLLHQEQSKKSPLEKKSGLNKYLDLTLLRNSSFVVYATSMMLVTTCYITAQMLVADHAILQGATETEAALLLSMIGMLDMIGRLLSGVLFDLPVIRTRRRHVFNFCQLVSSLAVLAWPFSPSYVFLVTSCGIHALFTGSMISQRATVVVDLIGVEHLSSSFGLTVFFQGVGLIIGPLIAGFLRDSTDDYMWSFLFTSACGLIASALFFCEYLCQRNSLCRTASKKKSLSSSPDLEIKM